jgi:hypothetical protein
VKKISMSQPNESANMAIHAHLQIPRKHAQCQVLAKTVEVADLRQEKCPTFHSQTSERAIFLALI